MSEITIYLEWVETQPDNRQYKQPSQVLLPKLLVAVKVPLEHTYFHNSADILTTQVAATEFDETVPQPILTPKGMRYVVDQLESQFQDDEQITADDFKNGDDGWGDEDASDSDGWEDKNDLVTPGHEEFAGKDDKQQFEQSGLDTEEKETTPEADDTKGWGDDETKEDDEFSKGADFDVDKEWD